MAKQPKSTLFKKYVASYVTVFSIPLLIFIIIINSVYINNLQEEITLTSQSLINQVDQKIDEQILEVNAIGHQIRYENRGYSGDELADQIELVNNLKSYDISTRATEAIYVLLSNKGQVASSNGMLSVQALLNNVNYFDVVETEKLLTLLSEQKEKIAIFESNRKRYDSDTPMHMVFYTIPLIKSVNNDGVIIFVLNKTMLLNTLMSGSNNPEAISYIMDNDGNVLLKSGDFTDFPLDDIADYHDGIVNNDKVTIERTQYMANSVKNDLTGWTIVSLNPTSQYYAPLYKVLALFGVLIVLLLLVGAAISYYFAHLHYKPIKVLANSFSVTKEGFTDELDFLQTNINLTTKENSKLYQMMNDQAPIIRNGLLLNLIEGKNIEKQTIFSDIQEVGVHFPYRQFAIVQIVFKNNPEQADSIADIENIVHSLSNKEHDIPNVYIEAAVPYLRNNQILMIVNYEEETRSMWDEVLGFIKEQIIIGDSTQKNNWNIAIGNSYDSILRLKNSYLEASTAIEEIASYDNQVIFFKNIIRKNTDEQSNEVFQYPKEELLLLIQSIKKGNFETAEEILGSLFGNIDRNVHNGIARQAIISDIVNNVLQLSVDLNLSAQYEKIYQLSDFSSTVETKRVVLDIVQDMCVMVNAKEESEGSEIKKKVTQYIYENYASPDISLGDIAAKINISISYASRLIKEETGESFSNIIQTLRMDLFKELLIATDDPIKDLIYRIGYYDASNFTRKFKKENGMTPGEFRDKFQVNG